MAEDNRDQVPDTIDELLGKKKMRQNIFGRFQNPEELKVWRNEQIEIDLDRLDKARADGRIEILHIEMPALDVAKIRVWINETGIFESVEDFVRRVIWNKLHNLTWDDLESG